VQAIQLKGETGVGIYQLATPEARMSKKVALAAVELFGPNLRYADPVLQDDKEVVMKAISWKGDSCNSHFAPGSCLKFASERLKDDKQVVRTAVWLEGTNLQYASDALAADLRMKHDSLCNMKLLEFAPEEWKNNKVVVSAAIKLRASNLMYASDEMKNTQAIVEAAVQQDPNSIKFASIEMQDAFRVKDSCLGA